jgi:hypothetical protein
MAQLIPQLNADQKQSLLEELAPRLHEVHPRLPEYFQHRLKRNPSASMPYHGNLHMALFVKAILEFEDDPELALTKEEFSALISAAIHHDFDYRTTTGDDIENIEAAQKAWRTGAMFWPTGDEALVSKLIGATYLEAKLDSVDPHYRLLTLMRDADLLGWIYEEYSDLLAAGLKMEKGYEPHRKNFLQHFTIYHTRSVELLQRAGIA